jgi:hypothetical protein
MVVYLLLLEFLFFGGVIRNDNCTGRKAAAWSCVILWVTCFPTCFFFFYMCNFWWITNISENTTQHHIPEDSSLHIYEYIVIAVRTLNARLLSNFSQLMECVKWHWLSHVKCSLLFQNVLHNEILLGNQLYQWQVGAQHFRDCLCFSHNTFMWWVVYVHAV